MGLIRWLAGDNEDNYDKEVVKYIGEALEAASDADMVREIEEQTGMTIRNVTVESVLALDEERRLRLFGGKRN